MEEGTSRCQVRKTSPSGPRVREEISPKAATGGRSPGGIRWSNRMARRGGSPKPEPAPLATFSRHPVVHGAPSSAL